MDYYVPPKYEIRQEVKQQLMVEIEADLQSEIPKEDIDWYRVRRLSSAVFKLKRILNLIVPNLSSLATLDGQPMRIAGIEKRATIQ